LPTKLTIQHYPIKFRKQKKEEGSKEGRSKRGREEERKKGREERRNGQETEGRVK